MRNKTPLRPSGDFNRFLAVNAEDLQ